jgi:hypothetical protein
LLFKGHALLSHQIKRHDGSFLLKRTLKWDD